LKKQINELEILLDSATLLLGSSMVLLTNMLINKEMDYESNINRLLENISQLIKSINKYKFKYHSN
jgi:hypothetical protein